jgi:hypothetical protein
MLAIAMTTAARAPERRYDERLSIEQRAERKHEWVDGRVLAMAGGTLREFGPGERAALSALDGALSVDRLYRGVVLESSPARG